MSFMRLSFHVKHKKCIMITNNYEHRVELLHGLTAI